MNLPILTIFIFTFILPQIYAGILEVPITHERRGVNKATFLKKYPYDGQAYLDRIGAQGELSGSADDDIVMIYESYIFGMINLGTPPQQFYVEFNDESSKIWVYNENFTAKHEQKEPKEKFYHSQSLTFVPDGRVYNEESELYGVVGEDVLHIGSLAVTVPFGMVDRTSLDDNPGPRLKGGRFGLSFKDIPHGILPGSLDLLANVLDKSIYTIWTNQGFLNITGVITFGSEDEKHCQNDFLYIPLNDDLLGQYFRDATLYSIRTTVNGKSVNWNMQKKEREFGMLMHLCLTDNPDKAKTIIGPKKIIKDMYKQFNVTEGRKTRQDPDPLGEIACTVPNGTVRPDITLVIGTQKGKTVKWVLKPEDYIIKMTTKKDKCYFIFYYRTVEGKTQPSSWYLGTGIKEHWCTAYDFKKGMIGFGHKK